MIHTIIFIIGAIMFVLAVVAGFIVAYSKEDKYPHWLTINWPVLLIIYCALIGLGYFGYLMYPHLVNILDWLRGLHL